MIMKTLPFICICVCAHGFSAVLGDPKPLFKFSSSDYAKILRTAGFVDKTLMIKNIIDNPGVALITAPPLFGKSTNLDMLKKFLEIEVDKDGNLITKANLTKEPVTDTSNYKLFVKHKLKITENEVIMSDHFGKSPVLSVDFKCLNIVKTFDEAVGFCRQVVHTTFKQHKYLLNSDQLTTHQKAVFEKWCNDSSYKELSTHYIAHGLRVLSIYLYRHFNKSRVFVIIDEHDSIISKAMFDVKGAKVLRNITSLSASMVSTVMKNNDMYVKGGLICGVSDIPVFEFSGLSNINTYRFLGNHEFIDYYGLTKEEVEVLFQKCEFKLNPSAVKDAHAAYNGYQSESGKKIYNTYSVLRFLKTGKVQNYWTKFGAVKKLKSIFKISVFKHYVEKLAQGNSISIMILEKLTVEDVIDLRNLLQQPHSHINYWPDTMFNFLFKHGYLTYVSQAHYSAGASVKKITVKLPNTEVTDYFKQLK